MIMGEIMKKITSLICLLLLLSGCQKVVVMSYNIHAMRGMDKVLDADRIARVINDQEPDLVALQEVDQFTERSGKMDAIGLLREKTGMHGIFMKTFDYQGGEFGNAILSRFPIVDHKLIRLPSREEYEPRLMMMVAVIKDNGDTLHFYNTHLDHHAGDSDRPAQMAHIIDVISRDEHPLILAGDLNCEPGSDPINALSGILDRCQSEAKTYPADNPERMIDHIFYTAERGLSDRGLKVIPEKVASDHRPVVTTFRLK
jgi:endonuclease/exonuclease/phosphatase family metal-dependent hydrolase